MEVPALGTEGDDGVARQIYGPMSTIALSTSAVVVNKLLNALVPPSEQSEYARYLTQFDSDRNSWSGGTAEVDNPHHYQYYQKYLKATETMTCSVDPESSMLSQKDRNLYDRYVGTISQTAVRGGSYDGYRRWLETGRYSVQPIA
jgi:hypothetical protein